ncbi:VCBS repeat-containing protein, partial [bacterium]
LAFTKFTLTGTAGNTKGVACGDYDGDGDQDAAVANDVTQSVVLLRNDGGLSFTQTTLAGTSGNNRDLKFIDYDSDGDLDLFVALSNSASVLRNDGDAGFTAVAPGGTVNNGLRVALADFDLDGDLDPVLVNNGGGYMVVYRSNGAGAFSTLPLMSSTAAYDASWGDYDGDGDPDALFGEVTGDDFLARNDGNGVFTRLNLTGSKANSNSAAWGDFDADGDLDVLLGKALTANAVLMKNVADTLNVAPSAPGGVATSFGDFPSSAALTVTWSAAAYDGALSTAGLSYSLVVASAPMALSGDSLRIVSPSSFVVTWNYALPPGGNAQKALYRVWPGDAVAKNGLRFRVDLGGVLGANFRSDATYYFRLQTLDAGLARSTWSSESSGYFLRSAPAASVTVGASFIVASYSTSGAAGYLLKASTASDLSGTLLTATAAAAAASVTLPGLVPGTTYYLRFGALWRGTTVWTTPSPSSTAPYLAAPLGCVSTFNVGPEYYTTIGAALAAVPASLSAETCVVVRDTGTYAEEVVVAGKTTNGFRLRIMADPALPSWPTIAPPANSTAAVQVRASSVSLEGLRIAPAFPLAWGIQVSSPSVFITSVLVQTTATLTSAGIGLNAFGTIDASTVSVSNTRGVWSSAPTESDNVVLRSSVTNASGALHALWFVGPRNAAVSSFIHNASGTAVSLGTLTRLEESTATTQGLILVSFASNVTSVSVTGSYLYSNTAVFGIAMSGSYHTVARTTVTLPGGGVFLTGVAHSTVSRVFASGNSQMLQITNGAAWNLIEGSTFVANGSFSAGVVINSSRNVMTASVFRSSNGMGLE